MVKKHKKDKNSESRPKTTEEITTALKDTMTIAKRMDAKDVVALKRVAFGYCVYGAVNAIEQLLDAKDRLNEYKALMKLVAELDSNVDSAKGQ